MRLLRRFHLLAMTEKKGGKMLLFGVALIYVGHPVIGTALIIHSLNVMYDVFYL